MAVLDLSWLPWKTLTQIPISAFGFDVDGVLRDTAGLAFQNCQLAVAELGGVRPELDDFVHEWCGSLVTYYRRCGVKESDEEIRRVNAKYLHMNNGVGPFADVKATLYHLKSCGVRLFALSGHGHDDVQSWCKKHDLGVHFEHVQGDGRDKVEHLEAICRQFGVDPSAACYAGDWGQDMRAAKQVGMIPIGVARSFKTHEVLRRNGAVHVVDHLYELKELVR